MTTVSSQAIETHNNTTQAVAGNKFSWLVALFSLWFITGLFVDGWAHNHFGLDSFFTPWHGLFYSGGAAVGLTILLMIYLNHRKGYSWRNAIPRGYETSVAGLAVFAVGGVGDMFWHILFGIEASVEALLSPTHLILATGMTLIVSGPLRAAWFSRASASRSWRVQFPMVLSLTILYSVITFFTQFAHPFERPWAALGNRPVSGLLPVLAPNPTVLTQHGAVLAYSLVQEALIAAILIQTVFLMSLVLLAIRRWGWRLPVGSLTFLMTLNALGMGFMRDELIFLPVALLTGVVADILLAVLQPSITRPLAFRIFAFLMPVVFYLLYYLDIQLTMGGIWWSIHLWLGSVVMSGALSVLVAHLIVLSSHTPLTGTRATPDIEEITTQVETHEHVLVS